MLDLHGVSSGGGTSLTTIGTILLGNDGQNAAGVPLDSNPGKATLVGWGGLTTIADTIKELKLLSQDQMDPVNGEDIVPATTTTSLLGILHLYDYLPYKTGTRTLQMAQNTGAANNIGYYMDWYAELGKNGSLALPVTGGAQGGGYYSVTSGALTALTWKATAFNPTQALPVGKYAVQGVALANLTNYALVRFSHADFGAFKPGFPVTDQWSTALANANVPKDPIFQNNLQQFTYLSDEYGKPCCPVFNAGPQSTGLNIEVCAITADTPQITLNIAKVG